MQNSCYRVFVFMIVIAGSGLYPNPLHSQERSSPAPRSLATVNGQDITEEELNRAATAELEKLEMQRMQSEANILRSRHQILENTLARLVEKRLLDAEAVRQGTTAKDLLAREVDQKVKEPTAEEVTAFYDANKSRLGAPKEQLSGQIRQYLKQQSSAKLRGDLITRLKKDQRVELFLTPFRFDVETTGHPSRGPSQAAVTIVEFSDFQCPYCKGFNSTLDRILNDYKGEVRLVFRQLPLQEIHPLAQKAAEASLCADEQGRFWDLHDLMFKEQSNLKENDLKAKAASLGLDSTAFNSCLNSGRYAAKIKADVRDSARVGVTGTPASFVNGRFLDGASSYEDLVALVREELQKNKR